MLLGLSTFSCTLGVFLQVEDLQDFLFLVFFVDWHFSVPSVTIFFHFPGVFAGSSGGVGGFGVSVSFNTFFIASALPASKKVHKCKDMCIMLQFKNSVVTKRLTLLRIRAQGNNAIIAQSEKQGLFV